MRTHEDVGGIDRFGDESVNENGLVLRYFSADWCGPCRLLQPVLEEVDSNYPLLDVVKIDVDANRDLADEFGVTALPTLYLYRDGENVRDLSDKRTYKQISNAVEDFQRSAE